MVTENIIVLVSETTDYVHAVVIVSKPDGDFHICMDRCVPNFYIEHENFKIRTQEYLFSELSGAKYFPCSKRLLRSYQQTLEGTYF